jgi:acetyltransferase
VGRLNKLRAPGQAEVAVLISDKYQNRGLGFELLRRLIQIAKDEKLSRVSSEMLYDNVAMQVISKRLGFQLRTPYDSGSIGATLDLDAPG